MSNPGRTWWGSRFLEALEGFTDSGRLQRGRGYSSDSRILDFAITDGLVTATVRGNVNPYFGVYKEPKYQTRIQMTPLAKADWARAIARIGSRADLVARLLMNEMPDDIESAFAGNGAGNTAPARPRSRRNHCCPAIARTSNSPTAPAPTTPTPASTSPASTTASPANSTTTPSCCSSCAASAASNCAPP